MKRNREAVYWAMRAIEDLTINSNKSALKDAKRHLEWSLAKVKEMLPKQGETTQ